MRDLRPAVWLGLPLVSFGICLAIALADPGAYRTYIRRHEHGLLEQGTVLCLAPAVVMGLAMFRRRREFPAAKLGWWCLAIAAGALYFGGEECSWGQNYFHWPTPEGWAKLNDQNETNLHNTSGLFDQVPRGLLTLAAFCGVVMPIALWTRRRAWDPQTSRLAWLVPTVAALPSGLLAVLSGLPQKAYGRYDGKHSTQTWYGEMFFDGRHAELKEFFLAMFILMYVWSVAHRLNSIRAVRRDRAERTTVEPPRVAA